MLPAANDFYARALCSDLRGKGLAGRTGDAWFEGNRVFGRVCSSLTERYPTARSMWRGVFGGLPDGTRLLFRCVDIKEKQWSLAYCIDSSVAKARSADAIRDWLAQAAPYVLSPAEAVEAPRDDEDEDAAFMRDVEFCNRFNDGVENETLLVRLLLERNGRRFFELDASSIEHYKAPLLHPAQTALDALGARRLGDVYSDADGFEAFFLRCYLMDDAPGVWISLMVFTMEEPITEFYSECTGSRSLTTTTDEYMRSREDLGIEFIVAGTSVPLAERLAIHQHRLEELRAIGHAPVDCQPTLEGFAAALERFVQRIQIR